MRGRDTYQKIAWEMMAERKKAFEKCFMLLERIQARRVLAERKKRENKPVLSF